MSRSRKKNPSGKWGKYPKTKEWKAESNRKMRRASKKAIHCESEVYPSKLREVSDVYDAPSDGLGAWESSKEWHTPPNRMYIYKSKHMAKYNITKEEWLNKYMRK